MSSAGDQREPEEPPIRFTDNRKIKRDAQAAADGVSSSAAAAADTSEAPTQAPAHEVPANEAPRQEETAMVEATLLDERTADLQRLQAEYANYRKRADRDRLLAGDVAVARVLGDLLPVVDDLDRAKAHGDLSGPLKAVADKLDAVTSKLGLVAFGEVGDPFDPSLHEAVLHDESGEVGVPTCTTVMRPGYRVNDRLLRPAMVGVSDPTASPADGPHAPAVDHDADIPSGPPNEKPEGDQPPVS